MTYYLRIEGNNLDWFVNDSSDLSTIRGGSLALLAAPDGLQVYLSQICTRVDAIITSASIGFFEVDSTHGAPEIESQVREWLNGDSVRCHATFSVSVVPKMEYATDRWDVIAANRWQQMQNLTQIYPELLPRTPGKAVCQLDHLRPAAYHVPDVANEAKHIQGESAYARREYGKEQKKDIFKEKFGLPTRGKDGYAHDFDDIGGNSEHWGVLKDKLAIFYADGNKFGLRQFPYDQTQQTAFSRNLRDLQQRAIRHLVEKASGNSVWINGEKLRMEVLLWGGDELMFVVPAWAGWAFAQDIFACLTQDQTGFDPPSLTWAASLIFCHQKAPIQRITKLAKNLVDHVKLEVKHSGNSVIYQVLESFDDIGTYPNAAYFTKRHKFLHLPVDPDPFANPLVLPADDLAGFAQLLPALRLAMPRRKLIAAAQRLVNQGELGHAPPFECPEKIRPIWQHLEHYYGSAIYYHLAEMWDYVDPTPRQPQEVRA